MNAMDAEVYYDLGVKRIIVAREISLKDCEAIKTHLPDLELEVFVHGTCAQPRQLCERLPFPL